jgi:hypothetical protein
MKIILHSRLFAGTESMADCTLEKFPVPSPRYDDVRLDSPRSGRSTLIWQTPTAVSKAYRKQVKISRIGYMGEALSSRRLLFNCGAKKALVGLSRNNI